MSVYQGDIVQLARVGSNEPIGWYQKLRSDNGNVNFYLLAGYTGAVIINSKDVTENSNEYNKQFRVVKRIGGDQISYVLKFDQEEAEKVAKNQDISASIQKIDSKIKQLTDILNNKTREYHKAMADLEDAHSIKNRILKGEKFRYLYAIFPGDYNSKEYCWRIPDSMKDIEFTPGGFAKVLDNHGSKANVIIRRVEESYEYLDHKVLCSQE